MELFSATFVFMVQDILKCPTSTVITTIPIPKGKPIPFVEEIRNHPQVQVFTVSIKSQVFIIDEIGKMELFSATFVSMVQDILKCPTSTVITTIPIPKGKPIPFVEEIRNHPQIQVFHCKHECILQDCSLAKVERLATCLSWSLCCNYYM